MSGKGSSYDSLFKFFGETKPRSVATNSIPAPSASDPVVSGDGSSRKLLILGGSLGLTVGLIFLGIKYYLPGNNKEREEVRVLSEK